MYTLYHLFRPLMRPITPSPRMLGAWTGIPPLIVIQFSIKSSRRSPLSGPPMVASQPFSVPSFTTLLSPSFFLTGPRVKRPLWLTSFSPEGKSAEITSSTPLTRATTPPKVK